MQGQGFWVEGLAGSQAGMPAGSAPVVQDALHDVAVDLDSNGCEEVTLRRKS